jgi:hypothetical protein
MNLTSTPRIPRFVAAGAVATLAAALVFSASSPALAAAPIGASDAYAVTENQTLNVAAPGLWANDSDPDGDALQYQSVWPPAGGPLPGESLDVLAGQGAFSYAPPTNFTGTRVWSYFINDGADVAGPFDVTFTITAPVVATAPVAVADAFDVVPGVPLVVPAPGLYANDSDADGDSWSYKFVLQPLLNALPGESLDISAGGGAFTYTPPTGFTGVRVWSYSIQGDDGESALVDITFTIGTPNAAPVAVADAYAATAGVPLIVTVPGVLGNDTDADADALLVSDWDAPAGGLLAGENFGLNANGSFEYEAPAGYSGTRVFSYRVSDGSLESGNATLTFTVSPPQAPNTTPIALPDAYTVIQDTTLVVGAPGVLDNDTDADGDTLTVAQTFAPAGGALLGENLVINADGSFEYNPAANFTGVRTWRYEATDGTDPADYVDIVFTVKVANQSPTPQPDYYVVESGMQLVVPAPGLMSNDTDPEGDPLTFSTFYAPVGGLLPGEAIGAQNVSDGSFFYTPPTGFVGTRVFEYAVTDGEFYPKSDVEIQVLPVGTNAVPVPGADAYTTPFGTTLTVDAAAGVLVNDIDGNGDPLTVTVYGAASSGVFTGAADGSFTFTPALGFSGQVTLTYTITDGTALAPGGTITITVGDAPVPPADPEPPIDPPASRPEDDLDTLGGDDAETTTLAATGAEGTAAFAGLAALLLAIGALARTISRRFT